MSKARDIASASPAPAGVSSIELGYVDGVTSAIQTQVNAKATNPMTTTGDTIYSSSGSTPARLGIGSTGNVLTVSSGVPSWVAPAGGGKLLQVVYDSTVTYSGSASATFADTGLTATITPSSTSSKILVLINQNGIGHSNSASATALLLQIVRGATTYSVTNSAGNTATNFTVFGLCIAADWLDSPATTSAITYKTQFASWNGQSAVYVQDDSKGGNVNRSTITLLEIGA